METPIIAIQAGDARVHEMNQDGGAREAPPRSSDDVIYSIGVHFHARHCALNRLNGRPPPPPVHVPVINNRNRPVC